MLGEVDSLTHFQVPQATEWQRIGDEIKAALIFARAEFRKHEWSATPSFFDDSA
jgi:hypothetical protein